MPEQLLLPGIEPPPQLVNNLFFAVMPDSKTAWQIHESANHWRHEYGLKGRVLDPDRLHISIYGLGMYPDLPTRLLSQAAMAAQAAATTAFNVRFDRLVSFSGKSRPDELRPLVLRASEEVTGLVGLRHRLMASLGKTIPAALNRASFTPHLTLLYDAQSIPEQDVPVVEWRAHELVLVQSHYGKGRYTILERWPFKA